MVCRRRSGSRSCGCCIPAGRSTSTRSATRSRCRSRRSRPTSRCSRSCDLIRTETVKATQGPAEDLLGALRRDRHPLRRLRRRAAGPNVIEVAMPLGLYTSCQVSPPCGLCSTRRRSSASSTCPISSSIPSRMQAALIWFGRGHVEYKFPEQRQDLPTREIEALEFSMELSSEVPGHQHRLALGHQPLGQRRAGRHLDLARRFRRQARHLHAALVEARGLAIRQAEDLEITDERLLRRRREGLAGNARPARPRRATIRSGCGSASTSNAKHPGGVNIFGRGFGNYDQDIVMRLYLRGTGRRAVASKSAKLIHISAVDLLKAAG